MRKSHRIRPWRLLAAAAVAIVALQGAAEAARKRVTVLPFDGPGAEAAQEKVIAIIRRKHAIIPAESFLKEAGGHAGSDAAIARAAQKLGVDAIVQGQIKRPKAGQTLFLVVRDGSNGAVVENIEVPLRGPKIDQEAAMNIEVNIMPALLRADGRGDAGGEQAPAAAAAESAGGDEDADEAAAKKKTKAKAKKADDEEGGEETAVESSDEEGGWLALHTLEVGAGLGVGERNFSYNNADLQAYSSGLKVGFVIQAETFPFRKNPGFLANLGASFMFADEPLGKAKLGDGDALKVTQLRYNFDVRYAWRLNDTFMVLPHLGAGQTFFSIAGKGDMNGDIALPSECTIAAHGGDICVADAIVAYVKVGADARMALSPTMMLLAQLSVLPGVMIGQGNGQIATEEASDSAFGFNFGVGLSYKMMETLALRGALTFTRFSHSLSGAPDCGATSPCYSSATDTYYGVQVTGLYLY